MGTSVPRSPSCCDYFPQTPLIQLPRMRLHLTSAAATSPWPRARILPAAA